MKEIILKLKEKINNLNKKQKKYLYIGFALFVLLIILIIFWNIGIKTGIIAVSMLPVFFTTLFVIILPFIAVVVLTVVFGKRYFEVKKILTSYEKTFGLLYNEELDLDEKELLMYQNYLDEDN